LIHNGTIFNHKQLKKDLLQKKYIFRSETDSEVIAFLIGDFLNKGIDLLEATK